MCHHHMMWWAWVNRTRTVSSNSSGGDLNSRWRARLLPTPCIFVDLDDAPRVLKPYPPTRTGHGIKRSRAHRQGRSERAIHGASMAVLESPTDDAVANARFHSSGHRLGRNRDGRQKGFDFLDDSLREGHGWDVPAAVDHDETRVG